jgi:asparagine synthase (glutamine-hydrolysing)
MAERIARGEDAASVVRPWVLEVEGDFLVVMLDRARRRLYVFNDALARLSVYVHEAEGLLILSREAKFLTAQMADIAYDRQAIAEFIYFGHNLGERTFVRGIRRLGDPVLAQVGLDDGRADWTVLHTVRCDVYPHAGKSSQQVAAEAAEIFRQACADVHDTYAGRPLLVSLSGGFDSRAVAAGTRQARADAAAVTFQDAGRDAELAQQIARAVGMEWHLYHERPLNMPDVERLIALKDGLNGITMAPILSFLEQVRDEWGSRAVYLTGDGGDRLLPNWRAPVSVRSQEDVARFIVQRKGHLSLDYLEQLTGVHADDFYQAVLERVHEYPEEDVRQQFLHFFIFDRGHRFSQEGEDRNRCFFWSVAPFYSRRVVEYCLGVPSKHKLLFAFCVDFFRELEPAVLDIPGTRWRGPIRSWRRYPYSVSRLAFDVVPVWARNTVKWWKRYRDYAIEPLVRGYLEEALNGDSSAMAVIAPQGVRQVLDAWRQPFAIHNLMTVVAYARHLDGQAGRYALPRSQDAVPAR